ncbi:DUF4160 domain-containing protein [bacterium]|nr:DUF4160 domain-containing protein [bacterium]
MPEICRFYGIEIMLHYNDHNPPHFHVRYSGENAIVGISPIIILKGNLPPRCYGLVVEWATIYKQELLENWELAREHQPLKKIKPLD